MTSGLWIERCRRAWETAADADEIIDLCIPDASYWSSVSASLA
jgi:hypothetical protein